MSTSLRDRAYAIEEELVAFRRDLHMHPELSFQEFETGKKIVSRLQKLGIDVETGVAETGIVGTLRGGAAGADGPVVALRGDMDALPIHELNDVPYRSTVDNVMHACGHDVHTTSLLGAAMILSQIRKQLPGTVKFLFQPAEEINKGAKAMIAAGVLENPTVEAIFGLHTSPNLPAGQVGVKAGPLMAAVDTLYVHVYGEGGHGAVPDRARDAIVAASAIVQSLQSIVGRNVSPFDAAVVTIGTIHGGKANNIIADQVDMTGTCRSYEPRVREMLPEAVKRVVHNTAAAFDCRAEVEYILDLPAVLNDPELAEVGRRAVEIIAGPEGAVEPPPTGGGEDFAIYMQEIPGNFFHLGIRNEEKGFVNEWHHPRYDSDERALPIGAGILAQSALEYLEERRNA